MGQGLSAVNEFAMVGAEEGPGDNGAEMVFLRDHGGGVRFGWGVGLGRGRGDLSGHKDDEEEDGMSQGLREVMGSCGGRDMAVRVQVECRVVIDGHLNQI